MELTSSVATKSIVIDAPVSKVFSFVSNLANWPKWAIANVVAVKPGSGEWWAMETRTGLGRIRIRPDEASGVLDYDLISSGVQWNVTARVAAKGQGTEFTLAFVPPPSISQEGFAKHVALADKELARLKQLMEA
jgi:hypothetical protein